MGSKLYDIKCTEVPKVRVKVNYTHILEILTVYT